LLLPGVEDNPGSEALAEPVGQVPKTAEVFAADGLGGLDFDADHRAVGVLQHHAYLHLISVAVVRELHWLLGPGELARHLADREVLQQWPN